jgi:hypothetical protein
MFPHYYHIYYKNFFLQMFCIINEYDSDSKEWCFLPKSIIIPPKKKKVWHKQKKID